MKIVTITVAVAIGSLFATAALAQTPSSIVQRNVNQEQRIEQGLGSGQLSTQEASRLQRGEARIERMEAKDLKDGVLTQREKNQITRAQNAESRAIYKDKHNGVTGNPSSVSSQRMQADVQRNINQQARIEQGVKSGQLTNRETARLERGQAHVDGLEARAGRDGRIGPNEQRRIQGTESRQSGQIYAAKHNARTR
jgi:hypothetical protein